MSLNPLVWLETLVSWVLVSFHSFTSTVFAADGGWAWGLAIVLLVILIRILLIPLFVKQIKSQRNLQIIQPQVKEIQKKYAKHQLVCAEPSSHRQYQQLKELVDSLDGKYPQGRINLTDGTVQYQPGAPTRKKLAEQQTQQAQSGGMKVVKE